ncbi:LD-carboxypeptidase [bacterium]|nr:LD-carboxypeptidase [bacterium]
MVPAILQQLSVLATSSPLNPEIREEVEAFFSARGAEIRYLLDPFEAFLSGGHLFSAHSAADRLSALESFLDDDESDFLLAARGGGGAHELLTHQADTLLENTGERRVDRLFSRELRGSERIFPGEPAAELPSKVVCGFSDFTVVLQAVLPDPAILPIHGPTLIGFRDEVSDAVREENLASLVAVLTGGQTVISGRELSRLPFQEAGDEGVEGALVGGNLSILCGLAGTPFFPDTAGKIVFLEEVGERPHRVHRNLCHLRCAGFFDDVVGVILGEFSGCDHPAGLGATKEDVFEAIFSDRFFENRRVPVYSTEAFGHGDRNCSLPLGRNMVLSGDGLFLSQPLIFS